MFSLKTTSALLVLFALAPAHAAPPVQIDLGNGHFVVEVDDSVAQFGIAVQEVPGSCRPALSMDADASGHYAVASTDPTCQAAPYAVLRIHPQWAQELELRLSKGQLDFAPSAMQHIARMQASVGAGDIVGQPGVKRSWLFGAKLTFDQGKPGLAMRASVGAGQISLASTGPVQP